MLITNFVSPIFVLISSRSKRNKKIIVILGCILLIGHIIDIYNMIMPVYFLSVVFPHRGIYYSLNIPYNKFPGKHLKAIAYCLICLNIASIPLARIGDRKELSPILKINSGSE